MELRSQAGTAVRWVSVSTALTAGAEIFRSVILARFLSPIDFGLAGMMMVVIGFAQAYSDLGIDAAIIHRQDATKEQLSSLYWLNIFAGWIVFLCVLLLTPAVVLLFKDPRVAPLLRVGALAFLIIPLGKQFEMLLQKELAFRVLAKQEIIISVVSVIVAVSCAVAGFGVWTLVWTFLSNVILKALFLLRIGLTRFRPTLHFRRSDLKGFIGFGLYQVGERTVNFLSQRLDQILIGSVLGAQSLGYYNFAFNLVGQPVSRINPIFTRVAFPLFSKVQHDANRLRNGFLKLINSVTSINAPLLVGFAAVAPVAVPLIFGSKWIPTIALVQILSFVTLSRSIGNPIGSLQLAKGRADLGFKWNVLALLVTVPTIYAGGKIANGIGVAMALLILQPILHVAGYFYLIRPLTGPCGREYSMAMLKPIAMACSMGMLVVLCRSWLQNLPSLLALIISVAVGALAYLMMFWTFNRKGVYEFKSILFPRPGIVSGD